MRLVVDRRAYESVARKNNVPVAGSPTDSVNGKRAWTSDELRSATVLEPGFTTGELIAALKATPWNHTQTATDAPILEFDFLGGDGSFCGFGDGDDGGGKKKAPPKETASSTQAPPERSRGTRTTASRSRGETWAPRKVAATSRTSRRW